MGVYFGALIALFGVRSAFTKGRDRLLVCPVAALPKADIVIGLQGVLHQARNSLACNSRLGISLHAFTNSVSYTVIFNVQ